MISNISGTVILAISLITVSGLRVYPLQENHALRDLAKEVVEKLVVEDFSGIANKFDLKFKQTMTPEKMQEGWVGMIRQAGSFKRQGEILTSRTREGFDAVDIKCEFENGNGIIRVVFDSRKQIVGLLSFLLPAGAKAGTQAEQKRTEGEAQWDPKSEAQRILDLIVGEKFSSVRDMFNLPMKIEVSLEKMGEGWKQTVELLGAFKRVAHQNLYGTELVIQKCEMERGYLEIRIAFDSNKRISTLRITPSQ